MRRWASRLPLRRSTWEFAIKALNIILLDDHRDTVDVLAVVLEIAVAGSACRVCYHGADALAAAAQERPDVVISDLQMPGMDGHQFARAISDLYAPEPAPLLIAMSESATEVARANKHRVFDKALIKPVDIDALVTLLVSLG